MASPSSIKRIQDQIYQLDYPTLLKLFPGYGKRKQIMKDNYPVMREWIHHMASILVQVDDYIHDNLNNTSEFSVYYDKDYVQTEYFPFERFVRDVIQTKQWTRVPSVEKQRKQQIQNMIKKTVDMDLTKKRKYQDLVDQWYWIQFHIFLLRMIFENFVRNDYRFNQQARRYLPINNKNIYKHFWFPVKHEKKSPFQTGGQQQTKSRSVDRLLRQSLSLSSQPPPRRSVRIKSKSSSQRTK